MFMTAGISFFQIHRYCNVLHCAETNMLSLELMLSLALVLMAVITDQFYIALQARMAIPGYAKSTHWIYWWTMTSSSEVQKCLQKRCCNPHVVLWEGALNQFWYIHKALPEDQPVLWYDARFLKGSAILPCSRFWRDVLPKNGIAVSPEWPHIPRSVSAGEGPKAQ